MSLAPASPSACFDPQEGGLLLANMLSAWLDGEPRGETTAEAVHEPQDRRPSPQPIRLCLPAPVDARPSAPSPGEHGTPVRIAREGAGNWAGAKLRSAPSIGTSASPERRQRDGRISRPWWRCLDGTSGGPCLPWKPPDFRARTWTGIDCWSCVPSPKTLVIDEDGCYDPAISTTDFCWG